MDFAKAFDKKPHRRLLYKFYTSAGSEDLLTSGSVYGCLNAFKKWCWMVNLFLVLFDVLQGSVLGPVLFLIFMISRNIQGNLFDFLLFADDCVL